MGRDTRGDGRRRRRKRREEVWSRNKQQQKAGKEPPAAGDAEQKAGEGGGHGGLNPPYVSRRGRVTLLRPPGGHLENVSEKTFVSSPDRRSKLLVLHT